MSFPPMFAVIAINIIIIVTIITIDLPIDSTRKKVQSNVVFYENM